MRVRCGVLLVVFEGVCEQPEWDAMQNAALLAAFVFAYFDRHSSLRSAFLSCGCLAVRVRLQEQQCHWCNMSSCRHTNSKMCGCLCIQWHASEHQFTCKTL